MSKDDIYNALCAVFYSEEVRLENDISDIQYRMWQRGADSHLHIELIQAHARRDYFKTYMLSVLEFLKHFDR